MVKVILSISHNLNLHVPQSLPAGASVLTPEEQEPWGTFMCAFWMDGSMTREWLARWEIRTASHPLDLLPLCNPPPGRGLLFAPLWLQ